MSNDAIVFAEAAQEALKRFGEVTRCLQYGEGWACTHPATPDGPPRLIGHDDRGSEVWMRRYGCVAGHWYHVETPAPDAAEVNAAAHLSRLRLSASASW